MQRNLNTVLRTVAETAADEPWMQLVDGGIIYVRRACSKEIGSIHALTEQQISAEVAPLSAVEQVFQRNHDSFWTVNRASDRSKADSWLAGYIGLLHLNIAGLSRLEAGDFDAHEPDVRLVVPSNTRPAAIYVWAIVAPKVGRQATHLLAHALGAELYGGVPIFATSGSLRGLNLMKGFGFSQGAGGAPTLGQLFRLDQARVASEHSTAA
ncbi:MAG: hypothetical protein JOY77_04365 [Alphaproteobacteria bacterium]|nr:hypothetical protein [Alphaproteobacteria bacterium]MBV9062150.1 hypothetical protein [Alphaproteobacteria bacterium]